MKNSNKIFFGICTYNRKKILEFSAESIQLIDNIELVDIYIYDDSSTEYDEMYLKTLFPFAKKIIRQNKNYGADKNTSEMYEDFLKSDSEWLFNADSDLIYNKDIVNKIFEYSSKCNGFMTFFNCINHNTCAKLGDLVEKDYVGAAGCLLHRDVVKLILDNISYRTTGFDVSFSKLLKQRGYKLYSTEISYVQHIGVNGFNSRNIKFDYGQNFICDSETNAKILEDTFEEYVKMICDFRRTPSWKLFNFCISIPRRIRKVFWILKNGR